ncbi:MAG: sigma-70 family RNA polymerase sigma factor [Phycisphaerales bacterium]|nr:sigma-70 family RNA polymerase sigma factor [Phycisphaerales bacterium]
MTHVSRNARSRRVHSPTQPVDGGPAQAAAPDPRLEALARGDPAAFEALVRGEAGRMLAVARRILGNEHDAHDAVQDAFVSALRALPRFAGQSSLSTWLHRIAINAALMKLRTRRSRPQVSIESLQPRFIEDGHHADPVDSWSTAPDARAMTAEAREFVRDAIERLPETHRTVLLLRDIEELDTRQTAELLEIDPGTVKVRLHRARLALRQLLNEQYKGGLQ